MSLIPRPKRHFGVMMRVHKDHNDDSHSKLFLVYSPRLQKHLLMCEKCNKLFDTKQVQDMVEKESKLEFVK